MSSFGSQPRRFGNRLALHGSIGHACLLRAPRIDLMQMDCHLPYRLVRRLRLDWKFGNEILGRNGCLVVG